MIIFRTGKSTILNLVAKLFQPDSGRILIDDKDLNALSNEWV